MITIQSFDINNGSWDMVHKLPEQKLLSGGVYIFMCTDPSEVHITVFKMLQL